MYCCKSYRTGELVAVKIMEKRLLKPEMAERYKKEIYLIKSLDNPWIIDVIEYFEDPQRIYDPRII